MKQLILSFLNRRPFVLVFFSAAIVFVLVDRIQTFFMNISDTLKLSESQCSLLESIPCLFCAFLTSALIMAVNLSTFVESLQYLGLKKSNTTQLVICLFSLIPMALGYGFGYFYYYRQGVSLEPFKGWPFLFVALLIISGLFEEVFFRGFVFRKLREKSSFFAAAFISNSFWALGHAMELFTSVDPAVILMVAAQVVMSFTLGFALCYVFERSGYVLWGAMLTHFLFDVMAMFNVNHEGFFFVPTGTGGVLIFGGMALTILSLFALSKKFLHGAGQMNQKQVV